LLALGLIDIDAFIPDDLPMLVITRAGGVQDRKRCPVLTFKIDFIVNDSPLPLDNFLEFVAIIRPEVKVPFNVDL
jgi:hypothetical protein